MSDEFTLKGKTRIGKTYQEVGEILTIHGDSLRLQTLKIRACNIGVKVNETTWWHVIFVYLKDDLDEETKSRLQQRIEGVPVIYKFS